MKDGVNGGLGKHIYMEWIIPIRDYYCSIRKNEVVFEIISPLLISLTCVAFYFYNGKLIVALDGLSDLLPTAISILIGFTVMLITLLLTSSGDNVERLKKLETEKVLYKKPLTLYQGLHIQFSHSLFSEVFLLLLIFLFGYYKRKNINLQSRVILKEVCSRLNIFLQIKQRH